VGIELADHGVGVGVGGSGGVALFLLEDADAGVLRAESGGDEGDETGTGEKTSKHSRTSFVELASRLEKPFTIV
jgi:hypothetical protein